MRLDGNFLARVCLFIQHYYNCCYNTPCQKFSFMSMLYDKINLNFEKSLITIFIIKFKKFLSFVVFVIVVILLLLTNVTFINCLGNDSNIAVRGDWFTEKKWLEENDDKESWRRWTNQVAQCLEEKKLPT